MVLWQKIAAFDGRCGLENRNFLEVGQRQTVQLKYIADAGQNMSFRINWYGFYYTEDVWIDRCHGGCKTLVLSERLLL